jgi:3-keto steroid reductase
MSSLEASPTFYDSEDWQLISTEHSYESSKYQIDLIATHLDLMARRSLDEDLTSRPVRHFISEPGVCSTNVSIALTGPVLEVFKVWAFYIVSPFGLHVCVSLKLSTLGSFIGLRASYH